MIFNIINTSFSSRNLDLRIVLSQTGSFSAKLLATPILVLGVSRRSLADQTTIVSSVHLRTSNNVITGLVGVEVLIVKVYVQLISSGACSGETKIGRTQGVRNGHKDCKEGQNQKFHSNIPQIFP